MRILKPSDVSSCVVVQKACRVVDLSKEKTAASSYILASVKAQYLVHENLNP